MTWLLFLFALEIGFEEQDILWYTQPTFTSLEAGYDITAPYTDLEAGVRLWNVIEVGGAAKVYFLDGASYTFSPYDARFTFYAMLRWKLLSLGWEHLCIHPVLAADRPDVGFLTGGGDRIFLRVEGKLGGEKK